MPTKHGRRLVIDTSVTRSAGETQNPTSINCRKTLETTRDEQHQLVLTVDILEEWHRHRSGYSYRWLTSMFARKQVHRIGTVENNALRTKVSQAAETELGREEMLKDIHLIEAALATDRSVISLNERDRSRFKKVSDNVGEIKSIVWVNPDIEKDKCIDWLKNGASSEPKCQLGYRE